jgi:hypothetical protein
MPTIPLATEETGAMAPVALEAVAVEKGAAPTTMQVAEVQAEKPL